MSTAEKPPRLRVYADEPEGFALRFPVSPAESALELLRRHLSGDEYALAKLDTIDVAVAALPRLLDDLRNAVQPVVAYLDEYRPTALADPEEEDAYCDAQEAMARVLELVGGGR